MNKLLKQIGVVCLVIVFSSGLAYALIEAGKYAAGRGGF